VNKLSALLIIAILFSVQMGCESSKASTLQRDIPNVIKGVWEPGYIYQLIYKSKDEILELGVNTVYIIVSVNDSYVETIKSPEIGEKFGEDAVRVYESLIDEAKSSGFAVIVILEYGVETDGGISKKVKDVDEFVNEFSKLALKWARIAEEHNAEFFSPINEFDQVLKENNLDTEEIIEKEREFYNNLLPKIKDEFSGKIFCKLGSVHKNEVFNVTGCNIIGITITPSRVDETPDEFRGEVREYLSSIQSSSRELKIPWIVGEAVVTSHVVEYTKHSYGEYFEVIIEEFKKAENKSSGFAFMGWEHPIAGIKGTDAEGKVKQLFEEIDEFTVTIESYANLFSEVPVADLVAMTPLWPTLSGGPKVINFDNTAPGGITSDGRYLYVSDTNNNRILVFDLKNLTDQAEAINVIGQENESLRIPSSDTKGLYRPVGIATDGKWLFIADSGNERLVIYNLTTQQPVLMLGKPNSNVTVPIIEFPYTQIDDLAWDGEKLYATVRGSNVVVIIENLLEILNSENKSDSKIELSVLGVEGVSGCSKNLFNSPVGLDVDDKYLYVADRLNGRVLIWDKSKLSDPMFVLGYEDFNCEIDVEDPSGNINVGNYDVASNGEYLFVDDGRGRVLVFERDNLSNGALASFVIGRSEISDLSARQVPTKSETAVPRGLFADETYLYVADKNFYYPAVLVFNISSGIKNGMEAEYILGVKWPRNPKYDIDIINDKLFLAGQEYIGVFNELPSENYQYPDFYLGGPFGGGLGGVGVSSDGKHLCIIAKDGTVGIYNEIPDEPKDPDISIEEVGKYGRISGGAASGIACKDGKLAAVSSNPSDSKVLVWKSMPTRDDQEPDVCLTQAGGEKISEPYNVFIYNNTLFVAVHTGSKLLIYNNISALTDTSEPDLIIDKITGGVHDVFYDGVHLFVSAGSGVHVYHELPTKNRDADEIIEYVDFNGTELKIDPWGMYFDGDYLWVMTGCSEHYSFLIRIPTKDKEVTPVKKLMREDFKDYLEKGIEPSFLKAFSGIFGVEEKEKEIKYDENSNGIIEVGEVDELINHYKSDGCIDDLELLEAIQYWLDGKMEDLALLRVIQEWL